MRWSPPTGSHSPLTFNLPRPEEREKVYRHLGRRFPEMAVRLAFHRGSGGNNVGEYSLRLAVCGVSDTPPSAARNRPTSRSSDSVGTATTKRRASCEQSGVTLDRLVGAVIGVSLQS